MCRYCEDRNVIQVFNFNTVDIEIFLEQDGELAINAYNHKTEATEDICDNFEINYCPMCGAKLKIV